MVARLTDPTMLALTARDGSFAECGGDTHTVPPPLPVLTPDWLTSQQPKVGSSVTERSENPVTR